MNTLGAKVSSSFILYVLCDEVLSVFQKLLLVSVDSEIILLKVLVTVAYVPGNTGPRI
jgi:hypothetical protein